MNQKTAELRQALADAEQVKSQLNEELEKDKAMIKDLSSQLESHKKVQVEEQVRLQVETNQKTAELRGALDESEKEKSQLALDIEKDKAKLEEVNRQLAEHKRLQAEHNEKTAGLRQALAEAEQGKSQLADDLEKEKSKSADLNRQLEQVKKTKLLNEQSNISVRDEMVRKVSELQQNLDEEKEKSEEINCQYLQTKRQADDLGVQCTKLMQQLSQDRTEIANLQQQVAAKDAKLNELGVLHQEKAKQFEKSYQDGEILAAKLYKTRQTLKEKEELWVQERASMVNLMEEKLRDARIEHDSKMAKMKDRMVELHKEGKTKLECDNQGLLLTVDGYRRKVENLEIRCAKLQQQLAEMNERNLEVRKENQLLLIRLKSLDELGNDRKSMFLPTQANLRNNFKMEDEEGELFNNMYLADLKSGRCVSPGPSTTKGGLNRYSELSQRNSMLPPHLRTNYVALELDCEPPQDDTRDTMSTTFDDSSTGLISRRKVSGITSYKRPGPPTPSKRAGRLSLTGALAGNGGGEVQYKEVLRDANANVAGAAAGIVGSAAESAARTGRTKTPGKFKQMISSSSLLNNFQRDEVNKKTFFPYYI
uniref:Uncharacterized protein n=1 Tax=Anopheles maculatus TaxID=74869 RepID=A0A182S7E6_9DIPT